MDNFFRNKTSIDPINLQCGKPKCMILYTPLVTGGNTPNNVKSLLYAQYVRQYAKR